MTAEVNKYNYRRIAVANSYAIGVLPDGTKQITFQPIIYVNLADNQTDMDIIDLDKMVITSSASAEQPSVSNDSEKIADTLPEMIRIMENEYSAADSNICAEEITLNTETTTEIYYTLPEILKIIENDTILDHFPLHQPQPTNEIQDVWNQDDDLAPTNSIDNYELDFRDSLEMYCCTCENISPYTTADNCDCCQSLLLFHCSKCSQLFKIRAMVKKHVLECGRKIELASQQPEGRRSSTVQQSKDSDDSKPCHSKGRRSSTAQQSSASNQSTRSHHSRVQQSSTVQPSKSSHHSRSHHSRGQQNSTVQGSKTRQNSRPSSNKDNLSESKKSHHQCHQCKKTFYNSFGLRRHLTVCKTTTQCPHCAFKPSMVSTLHHHIFKYHQDQISDKFKCAKCHKKYRNHEALEQHKKRCYKPTKSSKQRSKNPR